MVSIFQCKKCDADVDFQPESLSDNDVLDLCQKCFDLLNYDQIEILLEEK